MQPWNYSVFPYQQQSVNFCPVQQTVPVMYYQQPQQIPQQIIYQQPQQVRTQQQQKFQQGQKLMSQQQTFTNKQVQQYSAIPTSQIKTALPTQGVQQQQIPQQKTTTIEQKPYTQLIQESKTVQKVPVPAQPIKIVSQQVVNTVSPQRISPQKSLEERLQELDRKLVETLKKSQEITQKLNSDINE